MPRTAPLASDTPRLTEQEIRAIQAAYRCPTASDPTGWPEFVDIPAVQEAVLPVLTAAHWHFERRMSRLPALCPRDVLATELLSFLWPLDWRAEGARRIDDALERLWGTAPPPDSAQQPGVYRPRCAHCGDPIPEGKPPTARYCKPSHRVAAHRSRHRPRSPQEAARQPRRPPAGQH